MFLSDVEDEVCWTNVETEWFRSDTPWMTLEKVDADELRRDMEQIIRSMPEDAIRWRFEIEVEGRHIGLVSSYYLNSAFDHTPWEAIEQRKNAAENHSVRALGIEICDMAYWGQGIGPKALTALMEYYRSLGENRFLLETWSGNTRMLRCAEKLGFREVRRIKNAHMVDGNAVDDLVLEKVFP
ncbi:MAG: GNAT family N-acetyltransferase [Clostridia bacterium]|nr:GNAT family N-acetyltransferase [Clostridia bacterium]